MSTSCGCTTATLKKNEYAPGESGEIGGKYSVTQSRGRQDVVILVETDSLSGGTAKLELNLTIEDPVTIAPKLVLWNKKEGNVKKEISIKRSKGFSVERISCDNENFDFANKSEENGETTIEITPKSVENTQRGMLSFRIKSPDGSTMLHYAHLLIK